MDYKEFLSRFDVQSTLAMLENMGSKGIIGTIVIGFLAGVAAKVIMPGKDPGGLIITTLIGIGGSWVTTWLGDRFGLFTAGHVPGFVAAVVGALLILLAYRIVFRRL